MSSRYGLLDLLYAAHGVDPVKFEPDVPQPLRKSFDPKPIPIPITTLIATTINEPSNSTTSRERDPTTPTRAKLLHSTLHPPLRPVPVGRAERKQATAVDPSTQSPSTISLLHAPEHHVVDQLLLGPPAEPVEYESVAWE